MATGSYDGIARVWDLHLTAVQPEPQTLATDVKGYAITSDGRVAVIVHSDGEREAFDLETGRRVTVSEDKMRDAFNAKADAEANSERPSDSMNRLSPTRKRRLVGDKEKLRLLDETTGQPLADNLRALNGAAAFSRSGGLLAFIDSPSTSEGDWLYLINAETGKHARDPIRLRNRTTQAMSDGTTPAINFREDDKQLVTGTGEVIDVATGEHLTEQIIPVAGDYFWLSNKALHVFTCDDDRAQLRHFELILDAAPEALLDIGTAVAEAQVNGNGALERSETTPAQLQKIAGSLSADAKDPVTKWARWFLDLDNPETRPAQSGGPVSPGENFKEMKSEKQQNTEETTVAPAASDQHQSP